MQKIALPVIFIAAVAAALFYVSQEEHGLATLLLLAGVLLVGQICATLPFILDARAASRAGTQTDAQRRGNADPQKIIANQQIIHEDLRSLGETLIRRLNALAEAEKTVLAELRKNAPAPADDLDELFEKICRALDERRENLLSEIDGRIAPAKAAAGENETPGESLNAKLDALGEQLEDLLCTVENLAPPDDEEDEEDDDDAAAEPESVPAERQDEEPADADTASVEDFPESEDDGNDDAPEEEAERGNADEEFSEEENADEPADAPDDADSRESPPPPPPAPARQGELRLGDSPEEHGATLVLEAMLGIGNKPFLRGNAAGLSETAGTPMKYVEIGKWSFDFEPFSEEISVRVLRNDDESDPLGETVTLSPGQTLELAYVPERA